MFEKISMQYDGILDLSFEAYCTICANARKTSHDVYYNFWQISKSIRRVKRKVSNQLESRYF